MTNRRDYHIVKVRNNGVIRIPAELQREAGVGPGDYVAVGMEKEDVFYAQPVDIVLRKSSKKKTD